jgi:hypothetical protein
MTYAKKIHAQAAFAWGSRYFKRNRYNFPFIPRVHSMPKANLSAPLESDICIHIFTVSAGMVGVCLTVIGILHIIITNRNIDTFVDDFLAIDALLFVTSCVLSYWAIRTRSVYRMRRLERIADGIFLLALLLMAGVCGFIPYTLAVH